MARWEHGAGSANPAMSRPLNFEAEFEAKSAKTECEKTKEAGEWKGIMKVVPTEAETKAGVEAIKVE
jgi:hypothetical protein